MVDIARALKAGERMATLYRNFLAAPEVVVKPAAGKKLDPDLLSDPVVDKWSP
jgi:hypothetical protein